MAEYDIFPNAEELAVNILLAADWPGNPRIGTKLPSDPDWGQGIIVISRAGGRPTERHRLDHPRIQVDVWQDDKVAAQHLAQLARVALHKAEGQSFILPPAFISGVDDDIGIMWVFDPTSLRPRYMFSVLITLHAEPGDGS